MAAINGMYMLLHCFSDGEENNISTPIIIESLQKARDIMAMQIKDAIGCDGENDKSVDAVFNEYAEDHYPGDVSYYYDENDDTAYFRDLNGMSSWKIVDMATVIARSICVKMNVLVYVEADDDLTEAPDFKGCQIDCTVDGISVNALRNGLDEVVVGLVRSQFGYLNNKHSMQFHVRASFEAENGEKFDDDVAICEVDLYKGHVEWLEQPEEDDNE